MSDQQPLFVTEHDVKEPSLLLRYLRKVGDTLLSYGRRINSLEVRPDSPRLGEIKTALQATGSHPLYLGNLTGETSDPQPAKVVTFPTSPDGLVLQTLRDKQLISVGTTSTGESLHRVIGGNPHTLLSLTAGTSANTISAFVYASTGTTVTSTGVILISFASIAHNQGSVYSAGTPTRLSAPSAGVYLAGGQATFSGSTSGTYRRLNMNVTGTGIGESVLPLMDGNPITIPISPVIYTLTSTDYLELTASHDAAVSLTVGGVGLVTFLSLHRLSS
jgi:hypothetical protein